jgi:hypothetical protein
MLHTIREEIATLDTSPRALRQFGLVVGGVFAAIAAVLAWRSGWALGPWTLSLSGVGGLLVLLGLVAPRTLRRVYRGWMGLAVVLGFVMTRVLLTAVFVLVVLPIGLALRVVGKELLDRGPDGETASYWKPKAYADPSSKRLEKYY